MALTGQIMRLLGVRPRTNIELQELCCEHAGGIARTVSKLIHRGRVIRIDGKTGRGNKATYAIREKTPCLD